MSIIQSVDSRKLAGEISRRSEQNGIVTDILLEVNIGREENKSGVLPEELDRLLEETSSLSCVKVRGLMSVPPICETKTEISKYFDEMYKIFVDISSKKLDNISMDFLSMGMSEDYKEAIQSGANMVRVGSALFGARIYR